MYVYRSRTLGELGTFYNLPKTHAQCLQNSLEGCPFLLNQIANFTIKVASK